VRVPALSWIAGFYPWAARYSPSHISLVDSQCEKDAYRHGNQRLRERHLARIIAQTDHVADAQFDEVHGGALFI
jgi:hypothetical protein